MSACAPLDDPAYPPHAPVPWKRREQIGLATLYLGDCRKIAPALGKVDVVLTDPPYGIGVDYGSFTDTQENVARLAAEWLPIARDMAERVAFTSGVTNQWLYPKPDWVLAWVEAGGSGSSPWGFMTWQPVLCYGKDPYLQSGKGRRPDTIKGATNRWEPDLGHPCPKPLASWTAILDRVSVEGTVCDFFMGSGTTGAACARLRRPFIGIEIEERYFDTACRRIEEAQRQGDMFRDAPA